MELTRNAYAAGIVEPPAHRRAAPSGAARLGYIRAEAQREQDTAQLFLAMGGGWSDCKTNLTLNRRCGITLNP